MRRCWREAEWHLSVDWLVSDSVVVLIVVVDACERVSRFAACACVCVSMASRIECCSCEGDESVSESLSLSVSLSSGLR